jgi:uncharacterized protein YlxW (UPF0749 family)
MPLPAALGTKAPGQLIKSDDWNALVAGVNAIESALTASITSLQATVTALDARVATAETSITDLQTDVESILANTYRVTLETSTNTYALGALAQLTATVRDARGNVPAPVNGERPWVDFVATWGQLKPAPGFTARAGVAARSISVQTDASGVARVRLSSELVHDMSDDLELDFASFLDTTVGPQNQTFAQVMLAANTPSDTQVLNAYSLASTTYDNPGNGAVREYADSYYFSNSSKISGKVSPTITNFWRQRWRDHHITVLAFGKSDSDPRTPDAARGANAIEITFRDWLGPWIMVDYLPNFTVQIPSLVNVFEGAITNNYTLSANVVKDLMQERVQTLGLLGKTRMYETFNFAMDEVSAPQATGFLPQFKESMKSAVTLQQSFVQAQASVPGAATEEVALQAFTSTAVRADSQVSGVDAQVRQVQQQMAAVQQNVSSLGSRLDATTSAGGQLDQLQSGVSLLQDQVGGLRALGDPSIVTERINFIASLDNRLAAIERGTIG